MTEPLEWTSSLHNLDYYRERGGPVWVQALRSSIQRGMGDTIVAKPVPDYYLTIYRDGEGQVGEVHYQPRTKLDRLSGRTVTRLVREALKA